MNRSSHTKVLAEPVKLPSRRWSLSVNAIRFAMVLIVITQFVYIRINPTAVLFPIVMFILLCIGAPFLVVDVVRVARASACLSHEVKKLSTNRDRLLGSVKSLDASIRQEVAQWLHGTVQGDLLKLIRRQKSRDAQIAATIKSLAEDFPGLRKEILALGKTVEQAAQQRVNDIQQFSDEVVRAKSHSYYPPLLATSLQFALEDLLRDRATLQLDNALTAVPVKSADTPSRAAPKPSVAVVLRKQLSERRFLGPDTRYRVYRVVEEAVSNALKKNAEEISVWVEVINDVVVIRVFDNGSPVPSNYEMNFGLVIIDSLSTESGGRWSLTNSDGGVVLEAHIPMQPADLTFESMRHKQIEKLKRK
jgi:glucose-6-phosphate-specific signal transduction histidine kinase